MNPSNDKSGPSSFLFSALREARRGGYAAKDIGADLLAGAVVGLVAVPLSMALSIASGMPPQHGLYTAVVAGGLVALLGGSRCQVTGPTAAFVVILAPIVQRFGPGGLLMAGLMAGMLLAILGLARLGRLIQFIPYPVTTGFTSGIAVVIATIQVKDFFGLHVAAAPEHYWDRVAGLLSAAPTISLPETAIGLGTLAILILWPRVTRKLPSPLIALALAAVAAAWIKNHYPGVSIATIGDRFSSVLHGDAIRGIPPVPPRFAAPWSWPGADGGAFLLTFQTMRDLLPSAFAIALLGAIESLLSAVVADGMLGTRHDPDGELMALGIGNMIVPFFGGIPATGAIARTATNIRFGAKSPLASVFHALFVLSALVFFAPLLSLLPMASLAALLMLVAWNMAEVKHAFRMLLVSPRSDRAVFLMCFGFTVAFDMVIGVGVGMVLAAFLFMQRMAGLTHGRLLTEDHHRHEAGPLPPRVQVYEIAGALFFGAAEKAVEALADIDADIEAVIFTLDGVPAMDVTGLVSLEGAVNRLGRAGKRVYLSGAQPQPMTLIRKSSVLTDPRVVLCGTFPQAVGRARMDAGKKSAPSSAQG